MSLPINDPNSRKSLVRLYEREIGADAGFISANTNRYADFVADVNIAMDEFVSLAIRSSGTWQFDDSNHGDFPIIESDLISAQRDYTFTTDEQGNLILDIYRVFVKDTSGVYQEIKAVDQQSQKDTQAFWDGRNQTGTPTKYDKTANGILFDIIPNYNWRFGTEGEYGVKVMINREALYFSTSDTTRKPGVPGDLHSFFYIKLAYDYARRNNLASLPRLEVEYYKFIGNSNDENDYGVIGARFSGRIKDEPPRLLVTNHSNK